MIYKFLTQVNMCFSNKFIPPVKKQYTNNYFYAESAQQLTIQLIYESEICFLTVKSVQ